MLKRLRDIAVTDKRADIRGATVYGANDDKIGSVEDVILDTERSTNDLYAIVDSGGWLESRRFLVPSKYMRSRQGDPNAFEVPITREQIERLPEFDDDVLTRDDRFTDYRSRYESTWGSYALDSSGVKKSPQYDTRRIEPGVETGVTSTGANLGPTTVYAVYHDQAKLEAAVDRLKAAGFDSNDISAVFPDKNRTEQFAMKRNTKAPEGAAAGGGTGLVVGGVLGWLAGIGTLAIPGIGPLLAAGPIVAALAGAGAVGAVGGIAGALIGLGMPEIEAKRYEKELKEGRMMLSVRCTDPRFAGTARSILSETDAHDVFEAGERKAA